MQTNVLEYLEKTARIYPDKIAYTDATYGITFKQVSERAKAIGTFLADKGICKEPVAVCMKKSPEVFAAFLGVVYSGCYYIPMDVDTSFHRIESIFEAVKPNAVICDDVMREILGELTVKINIYNYDDVVKTPINTAKLDEIRSNAIDLDPVYSVFTSGSTGVPKGVLCSHRSVIDYADNISQVLKFDNETVFGNQAPLTVDVSLKDIYPTIKCGATTHFIPKSLFSFPLKLMEYVIEHKINTLNWVGSVLATVSACGTFDEIIPEQLRLVNNGGEIFPMAQFLKWKAALPETVFSNTYGPTEITGTACYYIAEREFSPDELLPIGRAYPNSAVFLLDENNQPAKAGELGEICVKGASLALGYWGDFDKTKQAFTQNPLNTVYPELMYRTGDFGRYNEHGELVFVSRKDNQIKHMGHRIELGEIDAVVSKVAGVQSVCCVYVKASDRLILYYTGETQNDDIMEYIEKKLPRYMKPYKTIHLDEMPLGTSGKIDRKSLTEKAETETGKRKRSNK